MARAGFLWCLVTFPALAASPDEIAAGKRFAEDICADCHAVRADQVASPNRASPPFSELAANPRITEDQVREFLRHPHRGMRISLTNRQIDIATAYLMSLKSKDGR